MGLYIEAQGEGPGLVLLHGWGLHGGIWAPVAGALARHYRLYRVDLPGHGHSPLTSDFTLEGVMAEVLEAVPARAHWLGWSLGGLVALGAAVRHPARVDRLVLVASAPRFSRAADWPRGMAIARLDAFADELERDYRGTLMRFLSLQTRGADHEREDLRVLRAALFERGRPALEALRGGLRMLREVDLRGEIARIDLPALWLAGAHDRLVHPDALRAAAALGGGRFEVVRGAGHAPFLSHPEAFVRRVHAFLAAGSGGPLGADSPGR